MPTLPRYGPRAHPDGSTPLRRGSGFSTVAVPRSPGARQNLAGSRPRRWRPEPRAPDAPRIRRRAERDGGPATDEPPGRAPQRASVREGWWLGAESNCRPGGYESPALPLSYPATGANCRPDLVAGQRARPTSGFPPSLPRSSTRAGRVRVPLCGSALSNGPRTRTMQRNQQRPQGERSMSNETPGRDAVPGWGQPSSRAAAGRTHGPLADGAGARCDPVARRGGHAGGPEPARGARGALGIDARARRPAGTHRPHPAWATRLSPPPSRRSPRPGHGAHPPQPRRSSSRPRPRPGAHLRFSSSPGGALHSSSPAPAARSAAAAARRLGSAAGAGRLGARLDRAPRAARPSGGPRPRPSRAGTAASRAA